MFYKYQKYKKKYIEIKNQIGGACVESPDDNDNTLIDHISFKDLKFKSSTTNMWNDRLCYCAKDAAQWIYNKSTVTLDNKNFPHTSILDMTTVSTDHPISINQIWYIIVNNNNNIIELNDMIKQYDYQCNQHEDTIKNANTFLYTQNQKEYIEKWLTLLKNNDAFIYSLNGIVEWISTYDKFEKILSESKLLKKVLYETMEKLYYSEKYKSDLEDYKKALNDYNNLDSTNKCPNRIDTDVTDENPISYTHLNYINNRRTSNNIKSEINARIYSNIIIIEKYAECDFNSFGFTRRPLLNKGYITRDELFALIKYWNEISIDGQIIYNNLSMSSKRLINYNDSINNRISCIQSILQQGDTHPDKYLRTYNDFVIFQLLDDIQKKNRTIFITCMMTHFDDDPTKRWEANIFEKFITGLYYELAYFKLWADTNGIVYNLLTWQLHLYKIANEYNSNNGLTNSVNYIHTILSYNLGAMNQTIALCDFYDVLFLIFIFGYFPFDPLIQFKDIWDQIEYNNSPIQIPSNILSNTKMEILPHHIHITPNYLEYIPNSLTTYLNKIFNEIDQNKQPELKQLISCFYYVIIEIFDIIRSYGKHDYKDLYYTSNDDNKLIRQLHKTDSTKKPNQQLDTTDLDFLKIILNNVLTHIELTSFNKELIKQLYKYITSIIKHINVYRYSTAKEYLASKKDELYTLLSTSNIYEASDGVINENIIIKIVFEIFKYFEINKQLKNTIEISS